MAKLTTVKPIALGYREVGSDDAYTPLMGVLKGLTIGQDEPDSTSIDAEFYDSPFDIYYDGNPITMTFELANYDLEELPDLFGGEIDDNDDYDGETNAYTSEWEWKLEFSRGHAAFIIVRGLTEGTIKKDPDGALNYSVTITSLIYHDTSVTPAKDVLYKIVANNNPLYNNTIKINNNAEQTVTAGQIITLEQGVTLTDLKLYGEHLELAHPKVVRNDSDDPEDIFYPDTLSSTTTRVSFFVGYGDSGDEYKVYKDISDTTAWFTIANA